MRNSAPAEGRPERQLPVTISTFTNDRKLYLSPGVNMRSTHPVELVNPVSPNPAKSEVVFPGMSDSSISVEGSKAYPTRKQPASFVFFHFLITK